MGNTKIIRESMNIYLTNSAGFPFGFNTFFFFFFFFFFSSKASSSYSLSIMFSLSHSALSECVGVENGEGDEKNGRKERKGKKGGLRALAADALFGIPFLMFREKREKIIKTHP